MPHHHGLAPQRRLVALLHGRKKRIHINVKNVSHRQAPTIAIVPPSPRDFLHTPPHFMQTPSHRRADRPRFSSVCAALVLLLLSACRGPAPTKRPLRVAAASDNAPLLAALSPLFRQQTGRDLVFSYGSSALLAEQIQKGAPFDVFLSAHVRYLWPLVRTGRVLPRSVRRYAQGQLALVVRAPTPLPLQWADLASPLYRRIALANPEHAPYGQAAVQALRALDLFAPLSPRLVYADNVRQAHQYLETGNVEAVLGALSHALADAPQSHPLRVPTALYQPLDQALALLPGADLAAAQAFVDLLTGPVGQRLLPSVGLLPPLAGQPVE